MAITDISRKIAGCVIVFLALSLILPQSLAAEALPEKNVERVGDNASCCPSQERPSKGIAGHINGFLAFGCCLNYRLTNWILTDKCDSQPELCDFSRDKPLCE